MRETIISVGGIWILGSQHDRVLGQAVCFLNSIDRYAVFLADTPEGVALQQRRGPFRDRLPLLETAAGLGAVEGLDEGAVGAVWAAAGWAGAGAGSVTGATGEVELSSYAAFEYVALAGEAAGC